MLLKCRIESVGVGNECNIDQANYDDPCECCRECNG